MRHCRTLNGMIVGTGSRVGAVVEALTLHQCGPGSIPGLGVEFVVGSRPCSERFLIVKREEDNCYQLS